MGTKHVVRRNYEEEVVTIFSAFQSFIEDKQAHNLSKSSILDYEDSFRYFMNYFEYDELTPLHIINNDMFKKWTLNMLERDIKPTSINRYLRDCKVFLNWCTNNALLYTQIQIDIVKGQEEPIKCFPDSDLILILQKPTNKCDFIEWRTWTIVNWVLATGNRAGTIIDVRIGDVDFKNREIILRHTKNKKAQIVPLSSRLAAILKEYLYTWRNGCKGAKNTTKGAVNFVTNEYDIERYQQTFEYNDMDVMQDPYILDVATSGAATVMANDMKAKYFGELAKISKSHTYTEFNYDAIVDALAEIGREVETDMFCVMGVDLRAAVRKDADYKASRQGEILYTGQFGSISGLPCIFSKLVPAGTAYITAKDQVKLFVKNEGTVEQDRDIETKDNTVVYDRHGVMALVDETKSIKLIQG